jgi:hypothetical protein
VITQSPANDWSASTPIAYTFFSQDHVGALGDLVERDLLALRLVDEVLRVGVQELDARIGVLDGLTETGDPVVHRRDADAAHRGHGLGLGHHRRHDSGEISGLLRGELQPEHVWQGADSLALAAAFGRVAVELVDAGEVDVGRLLCHLGHGRLDQEADCDDQVVPVIHRRRQVRQVIIRRLRHVDAARDAELRLCPFEAVDRKLVEAAVIQAAGIGDHANRDRLGSCRSRCGPGSRRAFLVAAAAGSSDG